MYKGIVLTVASLMLAMTAAFAQQGPRTADRHAGGRQAWLSKLNLTDQQKDQLAALRTQFEKDQIRAHANIATARLDLKALVQSGQLDRAAIEKAVNAISDLQRQEKVSMVDHLFKVNALLTPEQQKTFRQMLVGMLMGGGRMHERAGLHRGPMGGFGGMMPGDEGQME